jgi:hypothetical protein
VKNGKLDREEREMAASTFHLLSFPYAHSIRTAVSHGPGTMRESLDVQDWQGACWTPEPPGARIMRYELTDHEWTAIKPLLPNKPRGVPRANDRRILNGIFWILRSGAPWRDLPGAFGPYTTCYNRFVRWRRGLLPMMQPSR